MRKVKTCIKDIQKYLRPRERLIKYGVKSLGDDELLAIILRTGSKEKNVKELSCSLINKLGSINNLENATLSELSSIKGIGKVKAIEILASIELGKRVLKKDVSNIILNNNMIVYDMFKYEFINSYQEEFIAIFLDCRNKLITYDTLFKGSVSISTVHPREIFKLAIKNSASSIIVVHNHPSGNSNPSKADIELTNNLQNIGSLMKIPVIDHIIIGHNNYYSFYDKKVIYVDE